MPLSFVLSCRFGRSEESRYRQYHRRDDKPLKYPHIFLEADVCLINKIDLAPYLDTDVETLRNNALKVNHHLQLFEVSATKGTGMDAWCDWLVKRVCKM